MDSKPKDHQWIASQIRKGAEPNSAWVTLFAAILANVVVQWTVTIGLVDLDIQLVVSDFDLRESVVTSTIHCTTTPWIGLGASTSTNNKQRSVNVSVMIKESHLVGVAADHHLHIVLCKKRAQPVCVASCGLVVTNNNLPSGIRAPESLWKPLFLCMHHIMEPTHTLVRICSGSSTEALLADTTTPGTKRGILYVGVQHEHFQTKAIEINHLTVVWAWHLPAVVEEQVLGGVIKL